MKKSWTVPTFLAASLFVAFSVGAQTEEQPAPIEQPEAVEQPGSIDVRVQDETAAGPTVFESLKNFSSYGANIGLMKVFGGDLADGSQVKPVLQGTFRYRFSDKWIGIGDFGFGWNSFKDRGDTVLTMNFGTLGVERHVASLRGVAMRLGGGAGAYRWNYKWQGKTIRDPETQRFYRGFVPGVFAGLEGERRLTRHVTVTGTLQEHYVWTGDDKAFKRLFDVNHSFLSLRAGIHYHFSPYEGILWERKKDNRIRLESGQGGT